MGLQLCYRLTLPGHTALDEVRSRLAALLAFSRTLGFAGVYGPAELTLDELYQEDAPDHRDIFRIMVETMCGDTPDFYGASAKDVCAASICVVPGAECEPAVFGFVRPGSRRTFADSEDDLCPGEWYWSGCCKTQYASLTSNEHLLKCHDGLVRVLDYAATLGIGVSVDDETGYWDHRSPERLYQAVAEMNHLIARFAGALGDRLRDGHSLEAPIFSHPNFEHIEMAPDDIREQADGSDPRT